MGGGMGGGMVMKPEDTPSDSHLKRGRGDGWRCGENTPLRLAFVTREGGRVEE